MATISSSSSTTTATLATSLRTQKRTTTTTTSKIKFLPGINGYQGLKIHNNVVAMGTPISTEQCFANFASSMRATNPSSSTKKGGALSSTCNAAFEIFKIASIMNGLTLVGVAIGFVLLRIEASVEEAESSE